ncbi:MAG: Smr/MutS family protein [Deltaproteobacteria bacterium]|nr:Smr/MutS family protein [Deltaproteobacteria bacterium]MBW2413185.1 Smr/MutS family protein [Deltaproteobacteria bacterium]
MAPGRDGDGDESLFEEAMSDVDRAKRDGHRPEPAPPGSLPVMPPVAEGERNALRELDALVAGEGEFDSLDPMDVIEGSVPGLDPRVLRQLRRGDFAMQAEVDLHRLTADDARRRVDAFLEDAHGRGLRCVRIVHGHGRNSPGGQAVLKPSLPRWLARGAARRLMLAYTTAPQRDGGAGATYVLLRGASPPPRPSDDSSGNGKGGGKRKGRRRGRRKRR